MSRNFPANVADRIILGSQDIFDATFGAYSVLAFARVEDVSADRTILSKWATGSNRNFWLYFNNGTAPVELIVGMNADTGLLVTAQSVQLDTWYLVVITNDGTGSVGTLTADIIELDENFLVDGDTGDPQNELGTGESVRIGVRSTNADPFDGDIAHVCYVSKVISRDEKVAYLRNPWRMARVWAVSPGVEFYVPCGLGSPEPDFTKAVEYTIEGAPTISAMPPTARFTDVKQSAPLIEAATAGRTAGLRTLGLTGAGI